MRKKILGLLPGFFAVLGFFFLLAVLVYQALPAEEREKVRLVFMQAYSVWGEGWKPPQVSPYYTQEFNWGEETRKGLAEAYPLSEEGLALLSSVRFGRVPFNHYALGYASPFEKEVWTAVSRPQLSFHEFSHVAFANLVVGEGGDYEETLGRLQQALMESFTSQEYRSFFTACTNGAGRALWQVGFDPEHAFLSVLEWSGGNLALVPEPLRGFAPWIKEGEVRSWEQLARVYLSSDDYGRAVLELRYGEDNPFWGCARIDRGSSKSSLDLSSGGSYHPSSNDLVFLRAEERELRWFWEAKSAGAFAFWEEYFPHWVESYARDLRQRAAERHPEFWREYTLGLFGSLNFEEDLSELAKEVLAEIDPNLHEKEDTSSGMRIIRGGSEVDLEYLRRFLRLNLALDSSRDLWDGLERGTINLPARIISIYVEAYVAEPFAAYYSLTRVCIFWEGGSGLESLPTAITEKWISGGVEDTLQFEYGIPNSCSV